MNDEKRKVIQYTFTLIVSPTTKIIDNDKDLYGVLVQENKIFQENMKKVSL